MRDRNTEPTNHIDRAIQRTRSGDHDAFEIVVREYERGLRAWLAMQSPPGVDVDEVAQRSFVAAFTRLDDYRLGTSFSAWLFAIARYQLKTETTRLRRVADYHARYAPDLLQKELDRRANESPELGRLRLDHLQHCLRGLSEKLQLYIRWRYDEQISLDEMSQRSGRSVAAVKKQLWQIRQQLHACVENRLKAAGESP